MILKKPYAFLIKNFRIIHVILTLLMAFLFIKTFSVYSFFSRYVENVYSTLADANPSSYITIFMFCIALLVVAFSLAMYMLMKKKDKPRNLYIYLSMYYIGLFIAFILYFVLFKKIEGANITIKDAMVYRDITFIVMLPQIVLIAFAGIRAVGFDIKKFNFSKDLKELDIEEKDSEEFEFVLGVDSYKYYRKLRRKIREFKYYVLENKFMFTLLMSIFLSVMLVLTIINFTVYNKTYGKHQKVQANNLTIQLNNSYFTNLSYDGTVIAEDKYFLILNITFTNTSGESVVLDLKSFQLETKNSKLYPVLSRNNYFVDFGAGYAKEKIPKNSYKTYILVYEIPKKEKANKYTLKVIDSVEYNAGTMNSKYKKFKIKPTMYLKQETAGSYKLGDKVDMYGTILNNTSLSFTSFEFRNKYSYTYEACIQTNCREVTDVVTADAAKAKTLLVLEGNLKLDKTSTFAQNSKFTQSFFDAFVQIKFDDRIAPVVNDTPKSIQDKYILQVDERVRDAKDIDLIITIRDKKYIYDLK